MRKVCIVTGTRAEWGLLSRLAAMIKADAHMQLQIIATNMHLSERYGLTYKEIEAEGFTIDYRIPMEVDGDDESATVKSMAQAMDGFADAYKVLQPDLIVVLGDRYEVLVAVSAALIFKIPVAHLHGGEITEGAFDDAIRHAITKMSHLHFTSTESYRQRVIQMGEQPDRVFNVGAIGVDNIKTIPLWSREDTEKSLDGFLLDRNTVLITYHPVTMEQNTAGEQIDEILGALDELPELRVIFTMPNSDTGNFILVERIQRWCKANRNRAVWFASLGLKRYLSTLQYIGMVIGNSSSGILEVPSFGIPTLNIGDRQKGRIRAESVVDCSPLKGEIKQCILELSNKGHTFVNNPYEAENTAKRVVEIVKKTEISNLTLKRFYNIKTCNDLDIPDQTDKVMHKLD